MKKNVYVSPDMEVVKMNFKTVLLAGSDGGGSTTNPDDPTPGTGGWD